MIVWQLTVTKVDGSVNTYTVGPRQIVAFERQWKVGLAKAFQVEQKMEHLFWLAWEAERASGSTVPPFGDAYLDSLLNVEIDTVANPSAGTP
jgi:hypothetical protein